MKIVHSIDSNGKTDCGREVKGEAFGFDIKKSIGEQTQGICPVCAINRAHAPMRADKTVITEEET